MHHPQFHLISVLHSSILFELELEAIAPSVERLSVEQLPGLGKHVDSMLTTPVLATFATELRYNTIVFDAFIDRLFPEK